MELLEHFRNPFWDKFTFVPEYFPIKSLNVEPSPRSGDWSYRITKLATYHESQSLTIPRSHLECLSSLISRNGLTRLSMLEVSNVHKQLPMALALVGWWRIEWWSIQNVTYFIQSISFWMGLLKCSIVWLCYLFSQSAKKRTRWIGLWL